MAVRYLPITQRTDAVAPVPAVALFERCRQARRRSEVLRTRSRLAIAASRETVDEARQMRFVRLLAADLEAIRSAPEEVPGRERAPARA